jgi:hypothetical protein
MNGPARQRPAAGLPEGRPAAAGGLAGAAPAVPALPAGPGEAEQQEFDQEIRSAVRYEKGLAVKAVIALAIVALVILIRLFFLG